MEERFKNGDLVQHFKRETVNNKGLYIYQIIDTNVYHTETKERMVVYKALYYSRDLGVDYGIYCRPYDMFISEVEHNKYPNIKQKYRFEVIK